MQPLRFEVAPAVLALFPDATIGVVRGAVEGPAADGDAALAALWEEALAGFLARGLRSEHLLDEPRFAAWRRAYQAFGVQAKRHKPTHEALARRLLAGDAPPRILPLVDVYLTNQVAHLLPHGGYDVAALSGSLRLDLSPGGEPFEPIGGGADPTEPGEVVYRDAARVLTRRWNHRDCDATKIGAATRDLVVMLESPSPAIPPAAVAAATEDLARRYRLCFRGTFTATTLRLSPTAREFDL